MLLLVVPALAAVPLPAASPIAPFLAAGVGFPELVHVEAGCMLSPRVDVAAHFGSVLFNPELGLQADVFLLGPPSSQPPRHALLLSASAMINPTPPLGLRSGGERLGAYFGFYAGYAYQATSGFLFRAEGGALLYDESGPAVGGDLLLDVGWRL